MCYSLTQFNGRTAYRVRLTVNGRKQSFGVYASPQRAIRVHQEAYRQLKSGLIPTKLTVLAAIAANQPK